MNSTNKQGFSLIEVLVASTALVVLMVPIIVVLSSTLRTTVVSRESFIAQQYALECIEQLKTLPVSVGFEAIHDRPFPNDPAPEKPKYMEMRPGGDFELMGCLMFGGQEFPNSGIIGDAPIKTEDWTLTGNAMCLSDTDPSIMEKSRIFLSQLTPGYGERFVQIYRPLQVLTPPVPESNIFKARVKLAWQSKRSDSNAKPDNVYILPCLISNQVKWGNF